MMWQKTKYISILLGLFLTTFAFAQTKYDKDFEEFWTDVNQNYAYFDQQNIDWNSVKEFYQPQVKQISNDADFIRLLEIVTNEFYNGHVSLNTNLPTSNRIIPSGQDLFLEMINHKFYITDIRQGFGAHLSGLEIGDEIIRFNGNAVDAQIIQFLPKSTKVHSPKMLQYAINRLFAGTHDVKREVTVNRSDEHVNFYPDEKVVAAQTNLIDVKIVNGKTAYLKINNSLGNFATIEAFDKAIDDHIDYKNLIIDLSETPNGGNTTVARCILGRFIGKELTYQQHEFDETQFQTKRKWVEYVIPRKSQFKGKVFIIVGHWTGSMGEGIAIGFDGMKRAKIFGTEMASLLGAINSFTMSETKIGFQIPTERLYHVNGTARENFRPKILTANVEATLKVMNAIK